MFFSIAQVEEHVVNVKTVISGSMMITACLNEECLSGLGGRLIGSLYTYFLATRVYLKWNDTRAVPKGKLTGRPRDTKSNRGARAARRVVAAIEAERHRAVVIFK